jgi:hypothetical protein
MASKSVKSIAEELEELIYKRANSSDKDARIRKLEDALYYVAIGFTNAYHASKEYKEWCMQQGFSAEAVSSEGALRQLVILLDILAENELLAKEFEKVDLKW